MARKNGEGNKRSQMDPKIGSLTEEKMSPGLRANEYKLSTKYLFYMQIRTNKNKCKMQKIKSEAYYEANDKWGNEQGCNEGRYKKIH